MDGLRTTEMFAVLEAKVLHLERLGEPRLEILVDRRLVSYSAGW